MDEDLNKKETVTKYGEFVCSAYHWLPASEQKKKARYLANITENERKKEEN